ncbi:MAG: TPR repeat protein [Candidatus Methanoperedens nitroreducens]|uniref:TPR repeat protein n=1 Tax=Candidatus Methanoperedens nitratireducens TaxID=1392998 RepID=A0A0P8CLP7_9EURY|nr:MAG: TPR repeat protein [Candidatus Methanoperedens sp. BLZ1]
MDDEEELPEYLKDITKSLPKKKKIGRNYPCPCGSGKKYKKCCLGKDFNEINKKFFENHDLKQNIIEKVERYPQNSYLILQLEKDELCISTSYGPYTFKEFALYFSRNKIKLSDPDFETLFEEIREFLEEDKFFTWRSNKIVDLDSDKIHEIELIFMGYQKDFILKVMKETNDTVIDMMFLQRALLNYVGKMIHDFLIKKGYTSSYPRMIEDLNAEKEELMQEFEKDFIIDCRASQKLLYMSTLLKEIEDKCDSPIEYSLAKGLAINNIAFIQQKEITKSFPEKKDGEKFFTKPDILLWNDEFPIAIYCDGHDYHEKTPDQAFRDKNIDRRLTILGFKVLRFTGSEIHNNLERCVEEIKNLYLGDAYSKTSQEVLHRQLLRINPEKLNDWEKRFYNSMFDYLDDDNRLTLKQERIVKQILDKSESYKSSPISKLDKYDEELKIIEKTLKINPDDEKLWFNKGNILSELSRYDEALESYDKALVIEPDFDLAWIHKSNILLKLNKYDDALKAIGKALVIDPDFEEAWSNKSNILFKLNRYEEALESIDKALEINSTLAESWSNKSNALFGLKKYNEALEAIDKALNIDPDFSGAWSNKGNILSKLKRNDDALEAINKALKNEPNLDVAWRIKSTILYELNRYDEALKAIDKVIKIEPTLLWAWLNKVKFLFELNRYEEALKTIDKAIEIEPMLLLYGISKVLFYLT